MVIADLCSTASREIPASKLSKTMLNVVERMLLDG